MEPIRPDDDELRAERQQSPKTVPARGVKSQPGNDGGAGRPPGGQARNGLMYVVLMVVVIGVAGLWYKQHQRLAVVSEQLEETENWMRQSKLALARFEGDLTETGQTIDSRGSTLEQRLEVQKEQIEAASSEIRKLWVIAYEKNRPLLEEHSRLLEDQRRQLAGVAEQQNKQSVELAALAESLSEQKQKLAEVAGAASRWEAEVKKLGTRDAELASSTEALAKELDAVRGDVEQRLQRFVQEQKLATSGIEGRVSALERELQALQVARSQPGQTEQRLSRVEGAIAAIDAARAQLTSRLVRLSEQVDQLRQNQ